MLIGARRADGLVDTHFGLERSPGGVQAALALLDAATRWSDSDGTDGHGEADAADRKRGVEVRRRLRSMLEARLEPCDGRDGVLVSGGLLECPRAHWLAEPRIMPARPMFACLASAGLSVTTVTVTLVESLWVDLALALYPSTMSCRHPHALLVPFSPFNPLPLPCRSSLSSLCQGIKNQIFYQ